MGLGRSRTAALLALSALSAAAVAVGPRTQPLPLVASLLLVLVLPGLALCALLFPSAGQLDRVLALVLVPALSLATAVIAGVALGEGHVRLDRKAWAVTLGAIAAGAFLLASLRAGRPAGTPRRRLRPTVGHAVLTALAVLLAAVATGAIVLERRPAKASDIAGYTQLSLVPAMQGGATLRVSSSEFQATRYRLVVRNAHGYVLLARSIRLETGRSWSAVLRSGNGDTLTATLSRSDGTSLHVYRRAYLTLEPSHAPAGAKR